MEINSRNIGDICVLDLPKDIFMNQNVAVLRQCIVSKIEQGYKGVYLNFKDIAKIDGIGLGALLSFQKMSLYNKVSIKIFGMQPNVAQMMLQTRLNKVLDICQPEEDDLFSSNDIKIA